MAAGSTTVRARLKVGTRGSPLALAQARWVVQRLGGAVPFFAPRLEVEVIHTAGDRSAAVPRGEGVFVKEIQKALREGEVDLAVHSLKDLPTEQTPGLALAAIPEREDPRDCLVGSTLAALPPGARVGTGSPRRAAQLRRLRPDLEIVAMRGNVATRIAKASGGHVDAVALAAAGLARLGIEPDELLDPSLVMPAPGQGALAVEVRSSDEDLIEAARAIDHAPTRAAATAERAVLRALGGGCLLPLAAYARVEGEDLLLDAAATSPDGTKQIRSAARGAISQSSKLAQEVAGQLIDRGALQIL